MRKVTQQAKHLFPHYKWIMADRTSSRWATLRSMSWLVITGWENPASKRNCKINQSTKDKMWVALTARVWLNPQLILRKVRSLVGIWLRKHKLKTPTQSYLWLIWRRRFCKRKDRRDRRRCKRTMVTHIKTETLVWVCPQWLAPTTARSMAQVLIKKKLKISLIQVPGLRLVFNLILKIWCELMINFNN